MKQMELIEKKLQTIFNRPNAFTIDKPLKTLNTMRISGLAKYFLEPQTSKELVEVLKLAKELDIPYLVIGQGSNLIFSEKGFTGFLISLKKGFSHTYLDSPYLKAEAGVLLSQLAAFSLNNNATGFEFASTIPGTLGGALWMNAGAYNSTISDNLVEVKIIDSKGEIHTIPKDNLRFGYRFSSLSESKSIILEATFNLIAGEKEVIREKIKTFWHHRQESQPMEFPSAGSIFKNPYPYKAWELIKGCDLQGLRIGDAEVSQKHANFIVNRGNATSQQIRGLIDIIRQKVYDKYRIQLELEVILVN